MANLTVTLFEHQYRDYESLALGPSGAPFRERVLAALEQLNKRVGRDVLRLERRGLRTTSFVGVIRAGDWTVEILPKLGNTTNAKNAQVRLPDACRASDNLLDMLGYAQKIPTLSAGLAETSAAPGAWFERLTRLFAIDLWNQANSGLPYGYVLREESLPVLRGRWNIPRQAARHAIALQAFEVIHEEFSSDIALTQVFRSAVEQLRHLSKDDENLHLLGRLSKRLSTAAPGNIPRGALPKVTFHRLNERFRPAYEMASLFLTGSIPQITAGRLPVHTFLLEMNALFERFVAGFIEQHYNALLPPSLQNCERIQQSGGALLYLAHRGTQKALRLQPDLLFRSRSQKKPLLVLDTKYKSLCEGAHGPEITHEDAYQMLAYSVGLGCPNALLLYPQTIEIVPLQTQWTIKNHPLRITAASIDLRAPISPPDRLIGAIRDVLTYATTQASE
jgi:5-methylcytosine-specific restriction enzyme subunit McrC